MVCYDPTDVRRLQDCVMRHWTSSNSRAAVVAFGYGGLTKGGFRLAGGRDVRPCKSEQNCNVRCLIGQATRHSLR
ncbi:MAG: hypothetical protein DWQ08_07350 [Proteobacteria bacterium]|nr:MAG: hypothetical protein DWQ08_07350 [Pseudomonadota bacterium]